VAAIILVRLKPDTTDLRNEVRLKDTTEMVFAFVVGSVRL